MKRVGILTGREVTFPESIINAINERGGGTVTAEMVTVGGIRLDEPKKYDVIIDRISHEVPYYRAMLKRLALEGTYIINNPFWWSADDKFFNFSLAAKIGVAIPKTVLLPQHDYIKDITSESLRNLEFPIDWEGIVNYVGFPAFLKPHDGGGWKNVSKIHSLEELWSEYDQFVRCYCVGKEKVLIMPYDPSKPYLSSMQYVNVENYLSPELHKRVEQDVITICKALGYDLNTVEFAIKDGVPYAIDFMNPAPDAELASVGEYNHNWIVDNMTDFIFRKLQAGIDTPEYRWSAILNPPAKSKAAVTAAGETAEVRMPVTQRAKTAPKASKEAAAKPKASKKKA